MKSHLSTRGRGCLISMSHSVTALPRVICDQWGVYIHLHWPRLQLECHARFKADVAWNTEQVSGILVLDIILRDSVIRRESYYEWCLTSHNDVKLLPTDPVIVPLFHSFLNIKLNTPLCWYKLMAAVNFQMGSQCTDSGFRNIQQYERFRTTRDSFFEIG